MKKIVRLGLALILCAIPTVAMAQATGGTIAGMVFDESNAGVPGATVTIRQTETDARRVLVTDEQGRYSAPALVPGKYEIIVELQGFQTAQYTDSRADRRPGRGGGRQAHARRSRRARCRHRRESLVVNTNSGVAAVVDAHRSASCRSTAGTSAS